MSSSSADLAKLQAAVKDLQSSHLNLPFVDVNKENATNNTGNNNSSAANKALLQKYKSARQHYIQQRTTELFLEHLQQYNPATNAFPLPQSITPSERAELQSRQNELLSAVKETMDSVNGGMDEVQLKYAQLEEKREEFVQIVEGMERSERQRRMAQNHGGTGDPMTDDDVEEEDITESDVAQQQDHLNELQQRKLQLEDRLRAVRAQIIDVEDDCHRTKQVVNQVRKKTGRKPLDWRGFMERDIDGNDGDGGSNNVEYICIVDNEIVELQERAAELKQSGEFYDGIRELMEELGGVKILSSSACEQEEGFTLTLKLLGCHILEILLTKSGSSGTSLSVASAKLTTPTTFPMPEARPEQMNDDTEHLTETINQSLSNVSLSKIMSQKQTVSIVIPPLDDLVKWSRSLESSQGIRFVLVETMARIRTLDARVAELTHLRQNYAAQIYDIETSSDSSQFGGVEQEVVCAINEGITVALRLTVDCPLVPGSVYISDLFGVGGWEEEKLATLKKVVEQRRCKGPVEVMEVMVKEIRKRRNGEGWAIPLTPSLPRGGK
eukprot:scaffold4380_cov146-Skeletonema_menzelii.AAC.13